MTVDILVVDPEADRGHLRGSMAAMSRAGSLTAVGNRALAEARGQRQPGPDRGQKQPKLVEVALSVAPWASDSVHSVSCFCPGAV